MATDIRPYDPSRSSVASIASAGGGAFTGMVVHELGSGFGGTMLMNMGMPREAAVGVAGVVTGAAEVGLATLLPRSDFKRGIIVGAVASTFYRIVAVAIDAIVE